MPRITVIDDGPRRLLVWDGTAVKAVQPDAYHRLKYAHFDGNRIFHSFDGAGTRVEETYNDGIFNAYMGVGGGGGGVDEDEAELVVQISDTASLAESILANDKDKYRRIFYEWYSRFMQDEVVDYMIASGSPERVQAVAEAGGDNVDGEPSGKSYIVDGRFKVDGRGAAYVKKGGNWEYLCIVVTPAGEDECSTIEIPGRGPITMTAVTRTVMAKIAFLLYPTRDRVFLDQLPRDMRASVLRMISDRSAYQ